MPADLTIEIGEVALDEEGLQTLPAGEVTQRRRARVRPAYRCRLLSLRA
jgi:hypothetical protein